jgi:murein DD-endopeptidase MepM/ murein hydrolase activator NlpD
VAARSELDDLERLDDDEVSPPPRTRTSDRTEPRTRPLRGDEGEAHDVRPISGSLRPIPRGEGIGRASSRAAGPVISPRMTAVFGGLFGLATVASIFALLIQVFPVKDQRVAIAQAAAASSANGSAATSAEPARPPRAPVKRERTLLPQPWRVEDLKATHLIVKGEMKRRSFSAALDEEHVPKDQVYRVLKAFDGVHKFDHPKNHDKFAVAMERASKKIVGFEYEVGPTEIYQARANEAGLLEAKRLDMQVKQEEFATAFYVGKDFAKSYQAVGLEPGLTKVINEAFNGQTSTEAFQEGGIVKIILVETTALGRFVGYERIKALEYRPADPSKPPLRAYWFDGEDVNAYVDDRGRHPSNAGWRTPVPGAPITSHFNPKRMHPVLHTVMPHNGTDFGAPTGTPVYAAYRGKIAFIGPQGPSGNLVLIDHPGGVQTGYAHLSRFADGIKVGDPIGTRQLLGYVGSTGRSTGPHLHFSAKRDGKFFDALELKLDALQLLPATERAAFQQQKASYDGALEAIPLPEPPEPEADNAGKGSADESERSGDGDAASKGADDKADKGDKGDKAKADKDKGEKGDKNKPGKRAPDDGNSLLGEDLSGDIE